MAEGDKMNFDEIDNLLEMILFEDTLWVRLALADLEKEGVISKEERLNLVLSLQSE